MFNSLVRARDRYFALPPFQFEAVTLGLALLVGLIVMPMLIYFAGSLMLLAYETGNASQSFGEFMQGMGSLYADFFKGLFVPHSSHWIVVFGPFVFLSAFRIGRWILRKI